MDRSERPPAGVVLRTAAGVVAACVLGAAVVYGGFRISRSPLVRELAADRQSALAGDTAARSAELPGLNDKSSAAGALSFPEDAVSPHSHVTSFRNVAERVLPGVVKIDTERTFHHRDLDLEGPMRDRLRRMFPDVEEDGIEIPSAGSGFFVDSAGHVVTNYHVIEGAEGVTVTLSDGTTLTGRIAGVDPLSDLAIVAVTPPRPVASVPLGRPEELHIGDWVAAVGNPLGDLHGSLTVGVVSALGRHDLSIAGGSPVYQDFIQTDASINFGNSGGPLVNTRGEAVGINTAFRAPGRGIGFAISMTMARRIIPKLIAEGRVSRGYIGIRLQPLDEALAEAWEVPGGEGVVVAEVLPETPAVQAGLQPGDVILTFDGRRVAHVSPFQLLVAQTEVARDVAIEIWREGRRLTLSLVLAERPHRELRPEPSEALEQEAPTLEPESQTLMSLLGLEAEPDSAVAGGLRITAIRDRGPADRADLVEGDLIVAASGRSLDGGAAQLLEAAQAAAEAGRPIALRVLRRGSSIYVAVRPGSR
ncbi:MAG: PDZ domain-containing protein [Candidatus Eisenbacteria bacterium]|nr:PDZ domain-containing protein [Candidatus Eisenbacteria bacterium]